MKIQKGVVIKNMGLAAALLLTMAFTSQAMALAVEGTAIADDFVLGPTTPGKWGSPVFGTGATVSYSFMATGTSTNGDHAGTFSHVSTAGLGAAFEAAVDAAFLSWSAVANITFVKVADDGAAFNTATTSGDIRIGLAQFDGPSGVLAHGFYPPNNGFTAAGDIHFDVAETWKNGFAGAGFDVFQVAAHEIGHAIGLDHTGVPASLMNPFYTQAFSGVQADDIAGGQFIYGRPVVVTTPEPFTSMLMLLGLAGLAGLRRNRA